MTDINYIIVEHDGGWAYKLGDVYSETFPNHATAEAAAKRVAAEQQLAGETEAIEFQDRDGAWHEELSPGDDRPVTHVDDAARS